MLVVCGLAFDHCPQRNHASAIGLLDHQLRITLPTINAPDPVSARKWSAADAQPADTSLVCPCHGSEYTFAGAILKGPTERPLLRYRVTTDQEFVYISVDQSETS